MTARAAETVCDLVDGLVKSNPTPEECPSTSDCCSGMEDAQDTIDREAIRLVCASIDANAMYTKMCMRFAAKEVSEEYINSSMDIEGVDYRKAVVYLASAMTRIQVIKAGMCKLIPKRRYKKGPKPGVTSSEIWTRMKLKDSDYK